MDVIENKVVRESQKDLISILIELIYDLTNLITRILLRRVDMKMVEFSRFSSLPEGFGLHIRAILGCPHFCLTFDASFKTASVDVSTGSKQFVLELPIMTVILELEPKVELTAIEQAEAEGLPLAKYVESIVREAIFKRQRVQRLSEKSFDEILKPFRDEVEASGISDDKLDNLFRQARSEASQVRQRK